MPVALDACGTTFAGIRCQLEIFVRIPVCERLLAEVGAPGPGHDHRLDRVVARGDAELAEAVERDRADVALAEAVRAEQVVASRAQLVDRVRELHVDQPRRVVQPLHVVGQAEHGGPFGVS